TEASCELFQTQEDHAALLKEFESFKASSKAKEDLSYNDGRTRKRTRKRKSLPNKLARLKR
ncbi:unnamed protein product, partial [Ilex paraguariensis]